MKADLVAVGGAVGSTEASCTIPVRTLPRLTPAHLSRLRKLWSFGRPVHMVEFTGIDLDLQVHGLVEPVAGGLSASAVLAVTSRGVAHLSDARQAQIDAQRPHHELGHRLATYLQSKGLFTWENIEFGNPSESPARAWSVVRPDVFACMPALKARNASTAIYEVKVHRADFLSDLAKPLKRQAYAELAEAVYFCAPAGLIEKSEVPDGMGLLLESAPGVFSLVKKARRAKNFVMPVDIAMTLMVKRQMPLGSDL